VSTSNDGRITSFNLYGIGATGKRNFLKQSQAVNDF
jgi:hypothetical protein